LRPISSKITLAKEKQRKNRKKQGGGKWIGEKSNGGTFILLFWFGLNGGETNCGIAHILGILLMDSYDI